MRSWCPCGAKYPASDAFGVAGDEVRAHSAHSDRNVMFQFELEHYNVAPPPLYVGFGL